jgi:hypothetical protein
MQATEWWGVENRLLVVNMCFLCVSEQERGPTQILMSE